MCCLAATVSPPLSPVVQPEPGASSVIAPIHLDPAAAASALSLSLLVSAKDTKIGHLHFASTGRSRRKSSPAGMLPTRPVAAVIAVAYMAQ